MQQQGNEKEAQPFEEGGKEEETADRSDWGGGGGGGEEEEVAKEKSETFTPSEILSIDELVTKFKEVSFFFSYHFDGRSINGRRRHQAG